MVVSTIFCRSCNDDELYSNSSDIDGLVNCLRICYKYVVGVPDRIIDAIGSAVTEDRRIYRCFLEFDLDEIYPEVLPRLRSVLGKFIDKFLALCQLSEPYTCIVLDSADRSVTIKAYDWKTYWVTMYPRDKDHLLISSRFFSTTSGCGTVNRLYLRRDGALVFSHDQVGVELVHVVHVIGVSSKLAKLYDELHLLLGDSNG